MYTDEDLACIHYKIYAWFADQGFNTVHSYNMANKSGILRVNKPRIFNHA